MFEVGGGVLHACQPSVIRTEARHFGDYNLCHLKVTSREINAVYFLVIKCKQQFFGAISTICFSAGAGAQRCRGNWSKTGPQRYRYN